LPKQHYSDAQSNVNTHLSPSGCGALLASRLESGAWFARGAAMSSQRGRASARRGAAEQMGRACCGLVLGQDSGATGATSPPRTPRPGPCRIERSTYNIQSLGSTSPHTGLGRQHAGCCTEAPKSCPQCLGHRQGGQPQALRELNRENEMPEGRNLVSRPLNHAAENRGREPGRRRAVLGTWPAPTSRSIPELFPPKFTARPQLAAQALPSRKVCPHAALNWCL